MLWVDGNSPKPVIDDIEWILDSEALLLLASPPPGEKLASFWQREYVADAGEAVQWSGIAAIVTE